MKIGILGGSFNPVHIGHVNVGVELVEKKGFDQIWYVPAKVSPHKTGLDTASLNHRINMLDIALKDHPQLIVKDLEGKRPSPSYTIDTVRELLETAKEEEYSLIFGDDHLENLLKWKEPEEIAKLLPLVVVSRQGKFPNLELFRDHPLIKKAIQEGWVKIRLLDITSTEIRERIQKKLYYRHLLPEKMIDYIYENQLYCTN